VYWGLGVGGGGVVLFSGISVAQQLHLYYVLGRDLATVVWWCTDFSSTTDF